MGLEAEAWWEGVASPSGDKFSIDHESLPNTAKYKQEGLLKVTGV